MSAPLSVNPNVHSTVEVSDSCNCCFPFLNKKQPAQFSDETVIKTTDDMYKKIIIQAGTVDPRQVEIQMDSHKVSVVHSR